MPLRKVSTMLAQADKGRNLSLSLDFVHVKGQSFVMIQFYCLTNLFGACNTILSAYRHLEVLHSPIELDIIDSYTEQ